MRIQINFTENTEPVPFTYISNLNGYLHKTLGENNKYHDSLSLYSTSFLHGAKISKDKKSLNFKNGATWFISSPDKEFILDLIDNIYNNVDFAFGMKLASVNIVPVSYNIDNNKDFYIQTLSPILLKRNENHKNIYYTYEDDITSIEIMKNLILKKANKFGLNFDYNSFDLVFDKSYIKKKIKLIDVGKIKNRCFICPIKLKTKNFDLVKFIYEIGIGHSTGSGFGFVY